MSEKIQLTELEDVRKLVQTKYGAAAQLVLDGKDAACVGGNRGGGTRASCCEGGDAITGSLYNAIEAESLPEAAMLASLGCGNPTALASLAPGETVLDLGSGGGIDVLLSAKRVGPTGFAYGLDMTDEMLALAERNRIESGATNVQFIKGHIEEIPLPDNSVDVIISNCVINLSADKDAVLREAFRVLKPAGRLAVSDVVVEGDLPDPIRKDLEAYVGCVAGALERNDYLGRLKAAGFVDAAIEPTRRYTFADLDGSTCCSPAVVEMSPKEKSELDGRIMGAFIRAVKPVSSDEPCCATDCCKEAPAAVEPCCGEECCATDEAPALTAGLVQFFDPAMCCATGVCGTEVDPALIKIAGEIARLKRRGVIVERFNLGQQPQDFVSRPEILAEIQKDPACLPITAVNGVIVSRSAYPERSLLLKVLGMSDASVELELSTRA